MVSDRIVRMKDIWHPRGDRPVWVSSSLIVLSDRFGEIALHCREWIANLAAMLKQDCYIGIRRVCPATQS